LSPLVRRHGVTPGRYPGVPRAGDARAPASPGAAAGKTALRRDDSGGGLP